VASPSPNRARELYEKALRLPRQDRDDFLRQACGHDTHALRAAQRLLASHTIAESFLETSDGETRPTPRCGRYLLTGSILGKGGMGVVLEAFDPQLNRLVALKTISVAGREDATAYRKWLRDEARSAAKLSHPGIVTVHDSGEEGDFVYIVMERLDGPSVQEVLGERGRVQPAEALDIVRQAAAALDYAHGEGVIHRDVKPGNLMFHGNRQVKITDFGIAAAAGVQLTATSAAMGTPGYMSPEQFAGDPVKGPSDQFSLAVVAYQLLTGQAPWAAGGLMEKILRAQAPSACAVNPSLPRESDAVLQKALSRLPVDRYLSCSDFVDALAKTLAPPPLPPPAPGKWSGATVALLAGALLLAASAGAFYVRQTLLPKRSESAAAVELAGKRPQQRSDGPKNRAEGPAVSPGTPPATENAATPAPAAAPPPPAASPQPAETVGSNPPSTPVASSPQPGTRPVEPAPTVVGSLSRPSAKSGRTSAPAPPAKDASPKSSPGHSSDAGHSVVDAYPSVAPPLVPPLTPSLVPRKALVDAASSASAHELYLRGRAYETATGPVRNLNEAIRLYQQAAAAGSREAEARLAELPAASSRPAPKGSSLIEAPRAGSTRVRIPANARWTDTGVDVRHGQRLRVTASGVIGVSADGRIPPKSPGGLAPNCAAAESVYRVAAETFPAPQLPCWSLIGRVGGGAVFEVGANTVFQPMGAGRLFLGVNDGEVSDNSGYWTVTVSVEKQ
jgi:serine/threonine protein kinase